MNIKTVGADLAKNVFQVCVWLEDGTVNSNRKIRRNMLLHVIRQFPEDTLIAMEVCASAHHWARTFEGMGYRVALTPAQAVKPFARKQKGDASDALVICEAAHRQGGYQVDVKTTE